MPFKPVEHPKCPKCGKSVYAAEQMLAGGYSWHKFCFKCTMCNKLLDSTNCCEHQAELYCKQCHGRKYGPKGVGFGLGAGALSMDTGAKFGNKEVEMTLVFIPIVFYLHSSKAQTLEGYGCYMCNKLLDSTNCCEHEAALYCKQCHGRKYGPKGVGFGLGAGALNMDRGDKFKKNEEEQ
ncbi:LIM zinc-binding domain-containing protein [Aphelenchoides besseyi]|nr:LIM zinc-binding domain-containing protein [Aphelenchoides besseyi]KAI6235737.1 LIM zinc-binding domain-containing protein [Aphelenchoides besseyi]